MPNPIAMSTVRIGFIGCGGIARHHMNLLRDVPDCEIVGFADPSDDQIARCKKQFPHLADVPVFADWREMLDKVDLDATHINTPHTQHIEQCLASIAKGKHVICEKPLATTTTHANQLVEAIEKSGLVGVLAYQRHYVPLYRLIRDKIASGEFGAVTYFSAVLGQQWKRGTAGSWRQDPALSGGGQINDSGSHVVDQMLWATGLVPDVITAIMDNRGTPVDIDSAVSIRFKNGALGTLSILGDFPCWHEDFTIGCERGGFLVRFGELTIVNNDGSKYVCKDLPGQQNNPDRNFVEAILGKAAIESPFSCARDVIKFTEGAWKSAAMGGAPVKFDELS